MFKVLPPTSSLDPPLLPPLAPPNSELILNAILTSVPSLGTKPSLNPPEPEAYAEFAFEFGPETDGGNDAVSECPLRAGL